MKKAIERAIEGGWSPQPKGWTGVWKYDARTKLFHYWMVGITLGQVRWAEAIILNPEFWKCLEKAEGWVGYKCSWCGYEHYGTFGFTECCQMWQIAKDIPRWKAEWHKFIDHIAQGGDINSFFDNLLKHD